MEWAKLLLTFLSPICVVYITARLDRAKKKEESEKVELREMITTLNGKVDKMDSDLRIVRDEIDTMQRVDRGVQKDLQTLSLSYERNGKSIHQLAGLVIVLAEGMRDSHLDGNISSACQAYRDFESKQFEELMSAPNLTTSNGV